MARCPGCDEWVENFAAESALLHRLADAAQAALDRWWEHGLQDGEGQRLMRKLGDIVAVVRSRAYLPVEAP